MTNEHRRFVTPILHRTAQEVTRKQALRARRKRQRVQQRTISGRRRVEHTQWNRIKERNGRLSAGVVEYEVLMLMARISKLYVE